MSFKYTRHAYWMPKKFLNYLKVYLLALSSKYLSVT